jgi:hypothetical protein
MDGDICVQYSTKGLTVFAFKIIVDITKIEGKHLQQKNTNKFVQQ